MINPLVAAWANERLCVMNERPADGWQMTTALYESYTDWCQENGRPLMTNAYFTRRLVELKGIELSRRSHGRVVVGVVTRNHVAPAEIGAAFEARSTHEADEKTAFAMMLETLQIIRDVAFAGQSERLDAIRGMATGAIHVADPRGTTREGTEA